MILKLLRKISLFAKLNVIRLSYKNLSDKQIFEKIYKDNVWDKKTTKLNSGPGSHDPNLIDPYIKFLTAFFKKNPNQKIVDLGCGDFNIGEKIFNFSKSYTGIDIVEKVIKTNTQNYKHKKIKFLCLNILEDKIPVADCIIIRQVFQHLNNKSIFEILKNIKNFRFLIITEHVPDFSFNPNIDNPTGPTTRLHFNSGVDIEKDPFRFQFLEKEQITVKDNKLGGLHKTVIYKLY